MGLCTVHIAAGREKQSFYIQSRNGSESQKLKRDKPTKPSYQVTTSLTVLFPAVLFPCVSVGSSCMCPVMGFCCSLWEAAAEPSGSRH